MSPSRCITKTLLLLDRKIHGHSIAFADENLDYHGTWSGNSSLTGNGECMQVSTRNRVLILFDWMKTRVFGRDLSVF